MPNTFTTTSTKGYFSRIGESFVGALLGILMFFGSFMMLYWNEGRVDLSTVAKHAVEAVSPEMRTNPAEGTFVWTSGTVSARESIGDGKYLKPDTYLEVRRIAEIYAWVEEKDEKTDTNLGGSETTTTTYTYKTEWTEYPRNSNDFAHPEGHINPPQTEKNESVKPTLVAVGDFTMNGKDLDVPVPEYLTLTKEMVTLPAGATLSGDYIYLNNASTTAPVVGNERVYFKVVDDGFEGTAFGEIAGTKLSRYTDEDGNTLFRVFEGGRDEALALMHNEYVTYLWIFRIAGFLLMWIGLMAILRPLHTILDVLPIAGSIGKFTVAALTFVVSLVLSAITIIISMILHSFIAVIVVMLLLLGLGFFLYQKGKNKPTAPSPAR